MDDINTFNQVKIHNTLLIKNTLRSLPSGTKNTVAKITGLSIATCNTILNELAAAGEIIEAESDLPTIGRPPKLFKFNKDFSYICCLFLEQKSGKKYLNYAIVDLLGNILSHESFQYEWIHYEEIVAVLKRLITDEPKINTIVIGIPGYENNGEIESSGIEELNGLPLVSALQKDLDREIILENDMNAIAYGFYSTKNKPVDIFVMISFFKDVSLGSGIIINNEIFHGHSNTAGEILHLPYEKDVHELIKQGKDSIISSAAIALTSYCAILNPSLVIFTGEKLDEEMVATIKEKCLETISNKHLPDIHYESYYVDSYIAGLTQIAFDSLFK